MDLQAYLDRIGFSGAPRPDIGTLINVHRAHATTISYENLDVQLRQPLTRSPEEAFDKIVRRRRGGWCYEMNGLLGDALEAIGFTISRLSGAVMRDVRGDDAIGNHLVIVVSLSGKRYLADVGFGDGPLEPQLLTEGEFVNGPLRCALTRVDGEWWRYTNDPRASGPTFDFNFNVRREDALDRMCAVLQVDPGSPFVQNVVVQRWRAKEHYSLRGRVLRRFGDGIDEKSVVASSSALVATLNDVFDLDVPDAASLWPAILKRHDVVFAGRDPRA